MDREYVAFISYRHAPLDTEVASRLQRAIEQYRVPPSLRRDGNRQLGLVFRDEEELPASSDLSSDISAALDHSRYLIVVCTPDTPSSVWVRREIAYFLQHHDRDRVLAVLAAGEPAESFPPELTSAGEGEDAREVEPLAANVCAPTKAGMRRRLRTESVRLYAALLGCPYDALVMRQQRRRRRRAAAAVAAVLAVAVVFSGVLLLKNSQLRARNEELIRQRREVQLSESKLLTSSARDEVAGGDYMSALEHALSALPSDAEDDRPYYAPAEAALMSALNVFSHQEGSRDLLMQTTLWMDSPVINLAATSDGAKLLAMDSYCTLTAFDPLTGEKLWNTHLIAGDGQEIDTYGYTSQLKLDEQNGMAIMMFDYWIVGISLETGDLVWYVGGSIGTTESFYLSRDGTKLAYYDATTDYSEDFSACDLVILRADTGEELRRIRLAEGRANKKYSARELDSDSANERNGAFIRDDTAFFGALYTADWGLLSGSEDDSESAVNYFEADLETGEVRVVRREEGDSYSFSDSAVLWLGVDVPDGFFLVLSKGDTSNSTVVYRSFDLQTGELLWETAAQAKDSSYHVSTQPYRVMIWGTTLLVNADDQLYGFRALTGELFSQVQLQAPMVAMEGEDNAFAFLLSDGDYALGWVSGYGSLVDSASLWGYVYHLGEATAAVVARSGLLAMDVEENRILGFRSGEWEDGFGYVAAVTQEDGRCIRVCRIRAAGEVVAEKQVEMPDEFYPMAYIAGAFTHTAADGSLWMGGHCDDYNEAVFCRLNPDRTAAETVLTYPDSIYLTDAYIVEDGSGLMLSKRDGTVAWHDFATGETAALAEKNTLELSQYGTTKYVGSDASASSAYLSSGQVLTAYCRADDPRLRLWLDGAEQRSVPLPEGMTWSRPGDLFVDSVLCVGGSGCILLSRFEEGAERMDFALYDPDGHWTMIRDAEGGDKQRKFIMADTKPWFAVLGAGGILRVYDAGSPDAVREFRLGLPTNSVEDCRFVLDDACVAIYTAEGLAVLLDSETGELLYSGWIGTRGSRVDVRRDNSGRRVYLWTDGTDNDCVCLDAASWTELGRMTDVYGFDSRTDEICFFTYSDGVSLRRIPERERLIEIGQGLIAD